jgi:hypothetical protein
MEVSINKKTMFTIFLLVALSHCSYDSHATAAYSGIPQIISHNHANSIMNLIEHANSGELAAFMNQHGYRADDVLGNGQTVLEFARSVVRRVQDNIDAFIASQGAVGEELDVLKMRVQGALNKYFDIVAYLTAT